MVRCSEGSLKLVHGEGPGMLMFCVDVRYIEACGAFSGGLMDLPDAFWDAALTALYTGAEALCIPLLYSFCCTPCAISAGMPWP